MRGQIILDAQVLRDQGRALGNFAQDMSSVSGQAAVNMPGEAFGHLNSYLPGPCNTLAAGARSLLTSTAELLRAMQDGVSGVLTSFENIEEEAVAVIDGLEP